MCCMENVALADVPPAACTSLRCLMHDLHSATTVSDARKALLKNDRHIYVLLVVVVALVFLLLLSGGRRQRSWVAR